MEHSTADSHTTPCTRHRTQDIARDAGAMPQSPIALAAAAAAGALAATLLARRRRRTPAPSRVRHMVLVKLKPGTPSDAVDAMLAALRRLPARIPTILRIEVGRQVASIDDGRNASIGGLVEFASEDDYRAYAKDPAHVAVIKDYILPHMVEGGRAALQTSVDDWTPQAWTGPARTRNGRRRVAFEMRFDKTRLAVQEETREGVARDAGGAGEDRLARLLAVLWGGRAGFWRF